MSIASTLNNALSGLTAAARSTEVVSNNIANAMTEGYGRREIMLSSVAVAGQGAGVRIDGIQRIVDQTAIAGRRLAAGAEAHASVDAGFHAGLERVTGLPGDPGALGTLFAEFSATLAEAQSRPDDASRLAAVAGSADRLIGQFNLISTEIQTARMTADREIANQVREVNDTLARIADLNGQIRLLQGAGRDPSGLLDERQRLIDRVSEIIPIREVPREGGQVALFTPNGSALLDGRPAELGFTATGYIDPAMTIGSGALSGLTLNGRAVATAGDSAPLAGGSLAAQFAVRDDWAVTADAQIDALARDLIERFADPSVDPTLALGAPGLFTDAGAALDPAEEPGLAGRLALNALVDPDQAGTHWRLRDGLGAAAPGPVGEAGLLIAMSDALAADRTPVTGDWATPGDAAGLAAAFLSDVSARQQSAEADQTHAAFLVEGYLRDERALGVDTDQEMQKLLLIEQAYAANARVMQTADDMIARLLEI